MSKARQKEIAYTVMNKRRDIVYGRFIPGGPGCNFIDGVEINLENPQRIIETDGMIAELEEK